MSAAAVGVGAMTAGSSAVVVDLPLARTTNGLSSRDAMIDLVRPGENTSMSSVSMINLVVGGSGVSSTTTSGSTVTSVVVP